MISILNPHPPFMRRDKSYAPLNNHLKKQLKELRIPFQQLLP
jgi:hypothetical protein